MPPEKPKQKRDNRLAIAEARFYFLAARLQILRRRRDDAQRTGDEYTAQQARNEISVCTSGIGALGGWDCPLYYTEG